MTLPNEATIEWVEDVVGPFTIVCRFSHEHGYSNLWRLRAGGDHVWLKMHTHPHKWAGEVHALTRWRSPLAPELLAHWEAPCAVLLTEMPGRDAESIAFSPKAEARLWSEAGDWLRVFHLRTNEWLGEVLPHGSKGKRTTTDPTALPREGFEKRLQEGCDRGLLDREEAAFARHAFDSGISSLQGATVHSIHRDFHPRNWLAHSDGALAAVLDFEHARWDVRAADLNRPWDKEFQRNPRLIDAFYESYGRPDERTMAQVRTMRLYNAVTGLVWAIEVGDSEFSDFNRRALHRMMGS